MQIRQATELANNNKQVKKGQTEKGFWMDAGLTLQHNATELANNDKQSSGLSTSALDLQTEPNLQTHPRYAKSLCKGFSLLLLCQAPAMRPEPT